jgi:hypothetical protein
LQAGADAKATHDKKDNPSKAHAETDASIPSPSHLSRRRLGGEAQLGGGGRRRAATATIARH